jgi:hypothetical protein
MGKPDDASAGIDHRNERNTDLDLSLQQIDEDGSPEPCGICNLSIGRFRRSALTKSNVGGCDLICFTQEVRFMKTRAVCILIAVLISAFASSFGWAADDSKIVVMNPRGIQPEIRKIPMAARPATLDGKIVYIVDTKYPNTKPFVNELFAALQAKYPKTTWIVREKAAGYMDDDPNLWKEIKSKSACAIVLLGH